MALKQLFWACIIIIVIIWAPACSKKQIKSVVDDISRDIYENHLRNQRIENLEDPSYEEQPTYDQYQRERKEMLQDSGVTQTTTEIEKLTDKRHSYYLLPTFSTK